MDGQTFEITIRFAGFKSLRNCISCPFITITGVMDINESSISLLFKNMQNLLFEILDINDMFLGWTIWPTAITYSFCGIPSIELNTIACSRLGVISLAAILAKFNVFSALSIIVLLNVGCV